MTEFTRILKAGFINFKRGGLVSFAALLVTSITLSVIASIILINALLRSSIAEIEGKVDVTVYFVPGAAEEKILSLKDSLARLPEIAEISYVSAEQALLNFRARHKNDYPTIAALEEVGENPLGAYLNIKAREISQYESIASFLKSENALVSGPASVVDKVNYYQNKVVIDRLKSATQSAGRFGFATTLVLVFVSVIVMLNTIRLTIFISKEEITVMRLVGASKTRVSGPFLVEGVIYGTISAFLVTLLFWPATAYLGGKMGNFFGINLYEYYIGRIFGIFGILLVSGAALGSVSSLIAIRKYLNK